MQIKKEKSITKIFSRVSSWSSNCVEKKKIKKKIIFQLYFLSITLFSFYSIFSVNSDNFNDMVSAGLAPDLKYFLVILGLNPIIDQLSVLGKGQ